MRRLLLIAFSSIVMLLQFTESYDETVVSYPQTSAQPNLLISPSHMKSLRAVRYDMVTGGNAGAFRFGGWFDGEGAFIAFPNIIRSHLIFVQDQRIHQECYVSD